MPLWLAEQPLVLASQSDVRGKILAAAGMPVEIRPAQIDERAVEARTARRTPPRPRACWRAPRRDAVAATLPGRLVLGADQTLALRQPALLQAGRSRGAAASSCRRLRGTHP